MKWFWYSARPNELFLDVDYLKRALPHLKRRLMGAIEYEKLPVNQVYWYPSGTDDHAHIIITLHKNLSSVERFAWETVLHSDIYRGCCNLMRYQNNIPNPDILIARLEYFRPPEAICECARKHTRKMMESCGAAISLRGIHRTAVFFGKPSDTPCPFFKNSWI